MTRLALMLLLVGLCAGQPYRFTGGAADFGLQPQQYQQLAELFGAGGAAGQYAPAQDRSYAKPLSFAYMGEPLGQVQMLAEQSGLATPYSAFQTRMEGETFFKAQAAPSSADDDIEEVPYKLIKNYGPYEHRMYPSANFACVKSEVDTANDVLAGLEKVNPLTVMSSKRYRKTPSSIMFMELFKYISGVNKDNEEIEMTRPVSTLHSVQQKKFGGEKELQEMCFYVPASHQSNPPQPLDKSPVYIKNRPEMKVYTRRFGGYVLTADAWKKERDLLDLLLMGKPHHDNEYYTNGYNSPFVMHNRRNEVWIQDLEPARPVVAAVQAEMEDDAQMGEGSHHLDGAHKKDKHHVEDNHEEEIEPQPEVHVPFETAETIPKKAEVNKDKKE